MADPITAIIIQIKAETAEAAAALKDFVSTTQGQLDVVNNKVNDTLNKQVNIVDLVRKGFDRQAVSAQFAGAEAYSSFTRSTGGAMRLASGLAATEKGIFNNRLALMELGHVGRSTFEMMAMGVNPSRVLMLDAPRILQAMAFSGISLTSVLSTLGLGLLSLTPLVITGAEAWSAYKAKQNEARTAAEEMAQTQSLIARNQDRLNQAQKRGLVSNDDFYFIQKLLSIGSESALNSARQHMAALGIGGSLSDYDKLKTLERELHEEVMDNFDRESAKAFDVYQKRLDEIRTLTQTGGMTAAAGDAATQAAMAAYNSKLAEVEKEKQVKAFNDIQEAYKNSQIQIIGAAQAGAEKRDGFSKDEFENEIARLHDLQTKYPLAQDEIDKAVMAAMEKRNAGIRAETATEKEKTAELEKQKQLQDEMARSVAASQLSAIQNNPFRSEVEKAQKSIPVLQDLLAKTQASAAGDYNTALTSKDDSARMTALNQYFQKQQQVAQLQKQIMDAKGQNSFVGQLGIAVTHLQDMNNLAKETAQTFTNVFNSAVSSIGHGITGLIMGTMTWKQALMSIGTTILETVIQSIVEMGVRWILTQSMMFLFGKSLQVAATAALVPIAAAQAAIWWIPAVLSTIASYGAAAVQAPFLVMGALAGFDEGGYTGDGPAGQIAGVVHRGEYVIPASRVRSHLPLLQMIHSGALADMAAPRPGTTTTGGRGGSGGGGDMAAPQVSVKTIVVADMRQAALEAMASPAGERIHIQHANKNRNKTGVQT